MISNARVVGSCPRITGLDGLVGLRSLGNHLVVLAMQGNRNAGMMGMHFAINLSKNFGMVHQQFTGRGSHKYFDPRHPPVIGFQEIVQVVTVGPHVEAVIRRRIPCCGGHLPIPCRPIAGRRAGIGHLHVRCDAAAQRGPAFGAYAALVGQTRFAEMNLVIHQAR